MTDQVAGTSGTSAAGAGGRGRSSRSKKAAQPHSDKALAVLVERALGAPPDERAAAVAAARQAVVHRLGALQAAGQPTSGGQGSKLGRQELEALLVGLSVVDPQAMPARTLEGSVGATTGALGGAVGQIVGGGVPGPVGAVTTGALGGGVGNVVTETTAEGTETVLTPPAPVIGLFAQRPGTLSLSLAWTLQDSTVPCTGLTVALFEDASPSASQPVSTQTLGPEARATFIPSPSEPASPALSPGETYVATVTAQYSTLGGTVRVDRQSDPSLPVTLTDPDATKPLPRLVPDPLVLLSPTPEARQAAAQALTMADRWRSQKLLSQAIAVVEQANALEGHITQLQALQAMKALAGEQVLQPVLQSAIKGLMELDDTVADIRVPDLPGAVQKVVEAGGEHAILARFLVWLAQTDVIGFWIDLFGALIEDVATFDSDLTDTKKVIDRVLGGDLLSGLQAQLDQLRTELLANHDRLAAEVEGNLAEAVQVITAGLSRALSALDIPLQAPGAPGIPDPFQDALAKLAETVRQKLDEVRQALVDGLQALTNLDPGLFRVIVIVYLVLPIVAALAIGLAGGPLAAAALAAIVLVAVQQLIHLVLRLLTGPLNAQLDELRGAVDHAVANVRRLINDVGGQITATVEGASETLNYQLELVARGLQALRDVLPREYLDEAAQLLGAARDSLLRRATAVALAGEVALGQETGAVFDVLDLDYTGAPGALPRAPHLPGGTSPGRFAGERLLVDLSRLVEQQLRQNLGKETLLTQRFSLFDLLRTAHQDGASPADALQRLLLGQDVIIELSEQALLDATHPGAHRALIHRVRLVGLVTGVVDPATVLPVQLTHLGSSRTRVKREASGALGNLSQRLAVLLGADRVRAAYATATNMGVGLGSPNVLSAAEQKRLWSGFLSWAVRYQVRTAAEELRGPATEDLEAMLTAVAVRLADFGFPLTSSLVAPTNGHVPVGTDGKPFWLDDHNDAQSPVAITSVAKSVTKEVQLPEVNPRYGKRGELPTDEGLASFAEALSRDLQISLGAGKWGEARLEEDPNPDLRALGFAVLVRDRPPETLNLTLAPTDGPTVPGLGVVGEVATVLRARGVDVDEGLGADQYRLMENRGLGGHLLLRLPQADGTGIYSLLQQAGQPLARLSNLILELELRVCHDDRLATALRASSARTTSLDALVASLTGRKGGFLDSLPIARRGSGRQATLKYSLRSHRDRVLSAWKSAVAFGTFDPGVLEQKGIPPTDVVNQLTFLGKDDPLDLPGSSDGTQFDLVFALSDDSVALARRLSVTPPMLLGAAASAAGSGLNDVDLADPAATLTGLAYVVVPTRHLEEGEARISPGNAVAGWFPSTPKLKGLNILEANRVFPPVPLSELFRAGGADSEPVLRFDFEELLAQEAVYDVLVACFVNLPALQVKPAARVVR